MASKPDTQERRGYGIPWSENDMARLRELAVMPCGDELLSREYPARPLSSVKRRLYEVRHRLGLTMDRQRDEVPEPQMLDPDDPGYLGAEQVRDEKGARRGSDALLKALARMQP